jgi:hypothetical protein
MSEPFDPYRKWLGIPAQDQPPHHYRLLGISPFEDDPDVIENAANRQMQHVRTYQQGRNAAHSQRILNELSAAKLILLDHDKKFSYDKLLRRELKLRKQAPGSHPPAVANGSGPAATGGLPQGIPSGPVQGHPAAPVSPPSIAEFPPQTGIPMGTPTGTAAPFPPAVARSGLPVSRPTSRSKRRGRGRRKSSPWPLVLGMIAVVVAIGILVILLHQSKQDSARRGVGGIPQPPVIPPSAMSGTRGARGHSPTSPRSSTRQANPPSHQASTPRNLDIGRAALPEWPRMVEDELEGARGDPSAPGTSEARFPFVASPPAGPDRFDDMVIAARRAMAERDYPNLRDFSQQVNQETKLGDAEQVAVAAQLDAVRVLLEEFALGVRRALVRARTEPESFEVFGHPLILEPHSEGVTRYTFDGEAREFALDRFSDSLRGAAAEELIALADIGCRPAKPGEPESAVDRNYRRIYVAIFWQWTTRRTSSGRNSLAGRCNCGASRPKKEPIIRYCGKNCRMPAPWRSSSSARQARQG